MASRPARLGDQKVWVRLGEEAGRFEDRRVDISMSLLISLSYDTMLSLLPLFATVTM